MANNMVSKAAAALVCFAYLAAAGAFAASTGAEPEPQPQTQTQTETNTQTQAVSFPSEPLLADAEGIAETTDADERRMVALTFDDGPSAHTDRILDTLAANGAKATFFVVGQRVADYADVLRRAGTMGCQIGNHTFEHKTLTALSPENIRVQIEKTDEAVQAILGAAPRLLRVPGGNVNSKVRAAADRPIVLWSIDTEDWRVGGKAGRDTKANRDKVIRAATENAQDGDIILMHDLYALTAQCCETIIPRLREAGFELVTVDELMRAKQIQMEKGAVYRSAR